MKIVVVSCLFLLIYRIVSVCVKVGLRFLFVDLVEIYCGLCVFRIGLCYYIWIVMLVLLFWMIFNLVNVSLVVFFVFEEKYFSINIFFSLKDLN